MSEMFGQLLPSMNRTRASLCLIKSSKFIYFPQTIRYIEKKKKQHKYESNKHIMSNEV